MGTGSAGLIAYLVCIGFVAFVTIIGAGLVLYGRRSDRRKREARRLAAEAVDVAAAVDRTIRGLAELPDAVDGALS